MTRPSVTLPVDLEKVVTLNVGDDLNFEITEWRRIAVYVVDESGDGIVVVTPINVVNHGTSLTVSVE